VAVYLYSKSKKTCVGLIDIKFQRNLFPVRIEEGKENKDVIRGGFSGICEVFVIICLCVCVCVCVCVSSQSEKE
jgi:hypothetical protein